MQPWIDWARDTVRGIVAELQRAYRHLRCRTALVGYRDVCDADPFVIVPYTDADTWAAELANVRAFGGGDAAEDVFNGLRKVLKLETDTASPNDVTVLVHVCDAPCHGARYHDILLSDAHPKPHLSLYDGRKVEELVEVVAKRGWDYTFVHINASTNQMEAIFEEVFARCRVSDVQAFKRIEGHPVARPAGPAPPHPPHGHAPAAVLESRAAAPPARGAGAMEASPLPPPPPASVAAAAGGVVVPTAHIFASSGGASGLGPSPAPLLTGTAPLPPPAAPPTAPVAAAGAAAAAGGVLIAPVSASALMSSLVASLSRRPAAASAAMGAPTPPPTPG